MKEKIDSLNQLFADFDELAALEAISSRFSTPKCSIGMGKEGQVLAHMIFNAQLDIEVFTIDTGRLFEETYDLMAKTMARFDNRVKVYYPNHEFTQELVQSQGINGFYESFEKRRNCCFVRKVEPLSRALNGADLWITGLRAEQSKNRALMRSFEWDAAKEIMKFNPLLHWTSQQVDDYLKQHNIPYNALHDRGFVSVGCAPCTRAIEPGEEERAGRWWWEDSQKECGLHAINTSFERAEKS